MKKKAIIWIIYAITALAYFDTTSSFFFKGLKESRYSYLLWIPPILAFFFIILNILEKYTKIIPFQKRLLWAFIIWIISFGFNSIVVYSLTGESLFEIAYSVVTFSK